MNTVSPAHDCRRPSSSGVKYLLHLAVWWVAHGSRVKLNSLFNSLKRSGGVSQSSLLLDFIASTNINRHHLFLKGGIQYILLFFFFPRKKDEHRKNSGRTG